MTSNPPTLDGTPPLELTGERTMPGIWHENYWLRRHEAAYAVFAPMCRGARVLEAGCGEGYGGAHLASAGALLVVGVDLDVPTLQHVRATYGGVTPVRANLVLLPFADASLDVVVSAQTIEHLWDQDRFVGEGARVLRPGGWLALSTPNRRTFPAGNVFHSRELDARELVDLVQPHLEVVRLAAVGHGPRLRDWTEAHGDPIAAQLATAPAAWPDKLAALVRSVSVADFPVTDFPVTDFPVTDFPTLADPVAGLNASLDLILVARRRS